MQAPIHLLSGVIINRFFKWTHYRALSMAIMFFTAILLHAIFDKLAVLTYQPALPDFSNPLWVIYHIVQWLLAVTFLYIWWGDYKWGILFSLIPDLDWIVLFPQNVTDTQLIFYHEPLMHNGLNYFMDHVYPFCYMNNLIDCRANPLAVLTEVGILAVLLLLIHIIHSRRRNIHF
ncbi:MAG: hypothetical protein U0T74_11275 [Chitinophagales bacterium]